MKKLFIALIAAGLMMNCSSTMCSYAENGDTQSIADTEETRTTGLITSHYLSVYNSHSSLRLYAETNSDNTMKSIGIRNITIQRSSDNVNWTDYSYPSDMLNSDSKSFSTDTGFPVVSGYYYRVVCEHYAKE